MPSETGIRDWKESSAAAARWDATCCGSCSGQEGIFDGEEPGCGCEVQCCCRGSLPGKSSGQKSGILEALESTQ